MHVARSFDVSLPLLVQFDSEMNTSRMMYIGMLWNQTIEPNLWTA